MNREDLKEYKYSEEWIKGRLEYIEEYKTSLYKITATLSDMPGGSRKVQDSMAEKLAILMDNVDELMQRIVKAQKKQKEILDQLDKVEQPFRVILEKVYIYGETLVAVANEMNYNYKYMCSMHRNSIKQI